MRFEITHPNDLLAIEPDIIYSLYKLRVWLMRTRQWRLLGTMELGIHGAWNPWSLECFDKACCKLEIRMTLMLSRPHSVSGPAWPPNCGRCVSDGSQFSVQARQGVHQDELSLFEGSLH
jgi:hypothetical protein